MQIRARYVRCVLHWLTHVIDLTKGKKLAVCVSWDFDIGWLFKVFYLKIHVQYLLGNYDILLYLLTLHECVLFI